MTLKKTQPALLLALALQQLCNSVFAQNSTLQQDASTLIVGLIFSGLQ